MCLLLVFRGTFDAALPVSDPGGELLFSVSRSLFLSYFPSHRARAIFAAARALL